VQNEDDKNYLTSLVDKHFFGNDNNKTNEKRRKFFDFVCGLTIHIKDKSVQFPMEDKKFASCYKSNEDNDNGN
jgi:hypothetical protein